MTAVNLIFGPAAYSSEPLITASGDLTGFSLNDSNDAVGLIIQLQKSGTITKVGFLITAKVGTPPAYKIGLTTVDSNAAPTQTAYGGSSIENYTPTATGWVW